MAKHVYYKKKASDCTWHSLAKMDRAARVLKKRQQRHNRETSARIDQFISHYVEHKYGNIHTEAKKFHDRLKKLYPYKHDLKKTVEYEAWKRQASECTSNSKKTTDMELKMELLNYKPKTTTTTSEETSTGPELVEEEHIIATTNYQTTSEEISTGPELVEEHIIATTNDQTTSEEISTGPELVEEEHIIATTNDQTTNDQTTNEGIMEEDIWPSLDLQIAPEMLDRIIADLEIDCLQALIEEEQTEIDPVLAEFENIGANIVIDEQYSLEDELAMYYCK